MEWERNRYVHSISLVVHKWAPAVVNEFGLAFSKNYYILVKLNPTLKYQNLRRVQSKERFQVQASAEIQYHNCVM